jgi:arylsulfatase A-like enzyme
MTVTAMGGAARRSVEPRAGVRPSARKLTRKTFLSGSSAAAAGVLLGSRAGQALAGTGATEAVRAHFKGMNVVLFITDQERAIQHFPRGWAAKNLPGLKRLKRNGLVFENAFTNTCMCSPARSTLITGLLPAQHGVRHTLEQDMPAEQFPQVELATGLKNMASVMAAAGYSVVWKGKFHCNKPADTAGTWVPADVGQYGFSRWNPKDAGANQDLEEGGGGTYPGANNDERYMSEAGDMSAGHEGALAYLKSVAGRQQPFFMVISLVNPHDVLFYPKNFDASGYPASMLDGEIEVPATVRENLSAKPQAQQAFRRIFNLSGSLRTPKKKREYLNFYANLMKASDAYLVDTLDTLESTGLLDDTVVIRTADHGEMGLTHGGMRQKNFNFYEESLRVPLVFSNPKLFRGPARTKALVSHVDFLPTIASLFGAPASARGKWSGVDYSRLVADPEARPVQDYVVFTYDDFQAGQASGPYVPQPNHIVAIREVRWKIAQYYDPGGAGAPEWEMYDLRRDPLERDNVASPGYRRTPQQERAFRRLKARLAAVRRKRLKPRPTRKAIDISAATRQISRKGTDFTDRGSVIGIPTGAGDITLNWSLNPAAETATGLFVITSGAGVINGNAQTRSVIDGNHITLTGTADLTGGTGSFEGIVGVDLAFTETDTLDGQNGQVALTGSAVY